MTSLTAQPCWDCRSRRDSDRRQDSQQWTSLQGEQDVGRGSHPEGRRHPVEAHPERPARQPAFLIDETVRREAEAIYADEFASYLGIEEHNTRHETVNHSIEEWVVGDVQPTPSKASGACSSEASFEPSTRSRRNTLTVTSKNLTGGTATATTTTSSSTRSGASSTLSI